MFAFMDALSSAFTSPADGFAFSRPAPTPQPAAGPLNPGEASAGPGQPADASVLSATLGHWADEPAEGIGPTAGADTRTPTIAGTMQEEVARAATEAAQKTIARKAAEDIQVAAATAAITAAGGDESTVLGQLDHVPPERRGEILAQLPGEARARAEGAFNKKAGWEQVAAVAGSFLGAASQDGKILDGMVTSGVKMLSTLPPDEREKVLAGLPDDVRSATQAAQAEMARKAAEDAKVEMATAAIAVGGGDKDLVMQQLDSVPPERRNEIFSKLPPKAQQQTKESFAEEQQNFVATSFLESAAHGGEVSGPAITAGVQMLNSLSPKQRDKVLAGLPAEVRTAAEKETEGEKEKASTELKAAAIADKALAGGPLGGGGHDVAIKALEDMPEWKRDAAMAALDPEERAPLEASFKAKQAMDKAADATRHAGLALLTDALAIDSKKDAHAADKITAALDLIDPSSLTGEKKDELLAQLPDDASRARVEDAIAQRHKKLENAATAIFKAGEDSSGTDEKTIRHTLVNLSHGELLELEAIYKEQDQGGKSKGDFAAAMRDEFDSSSERNDLAYIEARLAGDETNARAIMFQMACKSGDKELINDTLEGTKDKDRGAFNEAVEERLAGDEDMAEDHIATVDDLLRDTLTNKADANMSLEVARKFAAGEAADAHRLEVQLQGHTVNMMGVSFYGKDVKFNLSDDAMAAIEKTPEAERADPAFRKETVASIEESEGTDDGHISGKGLYAKGLVHNDPTEQMAGQYAMSLERKDAEGAAQQLEGDSKDQAKKNADIVAMAREAVGGEKIDKQMHKLTEAQRKEIDQAETTGKVDADIAMAAAIKGRSSIGVPEIDGKKFKKALVDPATGDPWPPDKMKAYLSKFCADQHLDPEKLDAIIGASCGGRDEFDIKESLKGGPAKTYAEDPQAWIKWKMGQIKDVQEHERGDAEDRGEKRTVSERNLDAQYDKLKALAAKVEDGTATRDEMDEFRRRSDYHADNEEVVREDKDQMAAIASAIAGSLLGGLVALIPGIGPLATAIIAPLVAGTGTIITKAGIEGSDFNLHDFGNEVAKTLINEVGSVASFGVGEWVGGALGAGTGLFEKTAFAGLKGLASAGTGSAVNSVGAVAIGDMSAGDAFKGFVSGTLGGGFTAAASAGLGEIAPALGAFSAENPSGNLAGALVNKVVSGAAGDLYGTAVTGDLAKEGASGFLMNELMALPGNVLGVLGDRRATGEEVHKLAEEMKLPANTDLSSPAVREQIAAYARAKATKKPAAAPVEEGPGAAASHGPAEEIAVPARPAGDTVVLPVAASEPEPAATKTQPMPAVDAAEPRPVPAVPYGAAEPPPDARLVLAAAMQETPGARRYGRVVNDGEPLQPGEISAKDALLMVHMRESARGTVEGRHALEVLDANPNVRLSVDSREGSFMDPDPKDRRININPGDYDKTAMGGDLAHEAHHQETRATEIDARTVKREKYVNLALRDEAEAQARSLEHMREASGGANQGGFGAEDYYAAYDKGAEEYKRKHPGATPAEVHRAAQDAGTKALQTIFGQTTPSTSIATDAQGNYLSDGHGGWLLKPGAPRTYEELYGGYHDQVNAGTPAASPAPGER